MNFFSKLIGRYVTNDTDRKELYDKTFLNLNEIGKDATKIANVDFTISGFKEIPEDISFKGSKIEYNDKGDTITITGKDVKLSKGGRFWGKTGFENPNKVTAVTGGPPGTTPAAGPGGPAPPISTAPGTSTTVIAGGNRRSKRHHVSHKSKKHSHKKTLKRIKKFFQKK